MSETNGSSMGRRERRKFSAAEKLRIVLACLDAGGQSRARLPQTRTFIHTGARKPKLVRPTTHPVALKARPHSAVGSDARIESNAAFL